MVVIKKIAELLKNGEVTEEIRDNKGNLIGSVYFNVKTGEEEVTGLSPRMGYEGETVPIENFTDNQKEVFKDVIGYVPEEIMLSLIEGAYLYRDKRGVIRYLSKEDSEEIDKIGIKENGFVGKEIIEMYKNEINPPRESKEL
ncbi:MAG: hypothetical protein J7K87_03195 [Candidatus Aenigmarchaeota archaeon]|nr:hypothetical protein [Candidatus Aenigmarchaeota archaeon]